jgi:hypothetical protein
VRLAKRATTTRDHDVYRGPRAMPAMQPPLHFP